MCIGVQLCVATVGIRGWGGVIDRRAWGRRCNQREGELYYDCVSHTSWSELTGRTNFCGILDVLSYGITVLAKNCLLSLTFSIERSSLRKRRLADIISWPACVSKFIECLEKEAFEIQAVKLSYVDVVEVTKL